ncbi:hypothetical protein A6E15_07280 [Natrinema saccharevitans]|uniref:DUF8159 domain-containing protein n=1 Tax=Natrinema saccharevitans TaxID=301967 RepID=A0A1S8AWS3_9EURY|nr:hypothetical protein [Natrinema saccharevitans]OLZ40804.1 hypothetical protein A6E15_07280 [Natrinema saccharevitans]
MTDDSPNGAAPSRRELLGAATTVGAVATAGCLDSVLGTADSSENEIEPVEPSEPREGTPGEFYTLVERNDVSVESLRWDGSDLVLEYESGATTESESTREIEIVATVYNENLVKNDADVGMLYAEVTNPFDGQAHGWGVKTEWCEQYNEAVAAEDGTESDGGSTETSAETGDGDSGSDTDGATDNETDGGDDATAAMVLMSNVLNSRVYPEDLED